MWFLEVSSDNLRVYSYLDNINIFTDILYVFNVVSVISLAVAEIIGVEIRHNNKHIELVNQSANQFSINSIKIVPHGGKKSPDTNTCKQYRSCITNYIDTITKKQL